MINLLHDALNCQTRGKPLNHVACCYYSFLLSFVIFINLYEYFINTLTKAFVVVVIHLSLVLNRISSISC